MRVAAVVPFKRFTLAKRRLRSRYAGDEVQAIGRAMLTDVLEALRKAISLERVEVLTDDLEVDALARRLGVGVRLRSPDPGLNAAIEAAARELAAEGFDAVLIALGDLPLLKGSDVDRVVATGRDHPVVLVPSRDGGTALLYRRPPDRIPARFGPDSATRHREAARECGVEAASVEGLPDSARLDLDTPEDVDQLLASEVPCRTREVLLELER